MSDPLEDRLRDFAAGVPALSPSSPAEVRRRGDRLRRRRTMLATAGAALAVAVIAVPVFVLTSGDRTAQQPARFPSISVTPTPDAPTEQPSQVPSTSNTSDAPTQPSSQVPSSSATSDAPASPDAPGDSETTQTDPPAPPLTEAELPSPDDLPTRDGLAAWQETEPASSRLIRCQPDEAIAATDRVTRSYAARAADAPPGAERGVAAEIQVTILEMESVADAEAAEVTVTGWIRTCADPVDPALTSAGRQGELVTTENGTYGTWAYAATEVCTECDATWFDRMGVLSSQERLIVVSFRSVEGEEDPERLDPTMRDLLRQLAERNPPN